MNPMKQRQSNFTPVGRNRQVVMPVAPITALCSWCGRMRYLDGVWRTSDLLRFPGGTSHTVCPTCYDEAIPGMIHDLCEDSIS